MNCNEINKTNLIHLYFNISPPKDRATESRLQKVYNKPRYYDIMCSRRHIGNYSLLLY